MFKKHKKNWLMLAIALGSILVSSFVGSMIQSKGGSIKVTDLRDETRTGAYVDAVGKTVSVKGTVKSGILYMPNDASEDNKKPAIVLTHGYLNNRELQLPNAVELARRGFIVLTIDREGHGNYENETDANALMATSGMYDAVKYIYTLPQVDQSRIGITGHSMGGYTTAMTMYNDSTEAVYATYASGVKEGKIDGEKVTYFDYLASQQAKGSALGIVAAGLMQGWDTFIYADADVDVGILKAKDDEFFFGSTDAKMNPTICREYLDSYGAFSFINYGKTEAKKDGTGYVFTKEGMPVLNSHLGIEDGKKYVDGLVVPTEEGKAIDGAFKVIYEADEIHPLNHFSTESTGYVVDFFYNAFGTPEGADYIAPTNQVWVAKEIMATIGWAGIIFMIFPLVGLLLELPCFAELKKRRLESADGRIVYEDVVPEEEAKGKAELKGLRKHLSFWIPAVACTLFSGFSIDPIQKWASKIFEKTSYFPQDTTGWVSIWAICCGLFALTVILLTNVVNRIINHYVYKEDAHLYNENPLEVVNIGSVSRFIKTVILGALVVISMYAVLFLNWAIFKTDFRFWTFAMKVFEVDVMLPTILRYAGLFGIFYFCNAIGNQTYRAKNLPEWATIAINAAFNFVGILLVFIIQYGTFCSTGVMWNPDMNLSYIVLFPIIPVLICATIISRLLYKKTGNVWLGVIINTLLWTAVTVSGTAASLGYVLG